MLQVLFFVSPPSPGQGFNICNNPAIAIFLPIPALVLSHDERMSKKYPYYVHTRYYSQQSSNNNNHQLLGDHSTPSYKRPEFSESFKKHMEKVMNTFDGDDNGDGVDCTGEPSIDPSRMVMDNGLDSEYLFDFVENKKNMREYERN
jgi:hypothetical protein